MVCALPALIGVAVKQLWKSSADLCKLLGNRCCSARSICWLRRDRVDIAACPVIMLSTRSKQAKQPVSFVVNLAL